MTDEKYVFNQDVRERSKMKTGAMHKKNGCKSKKCTLPKNLEASYTTQNLQLLI